MQTSTTTTIGTHNGVHIHCTPRSPFWTKFWLKYDETLTIKIVTHKRRKRKPKHQQNRLALSPWEGRLVKGLHNREKMKWEQVDSIKRMCLIESSAWVSLSLSRTHYVCVCWTNEAICLTAHVIRCFLLIPSSPVASDRWRPCNG